eukprot:CAMPEP_0172162124 /NCGR_PEP_ID=MMETSP1050-20130122/6495_1 /TAXON_ID=233186 /ORGANISM="Cryptomonas curvata, Strain CCAP979/52" /LENGTH=249 /DNA_ID=CAMNT_0012832075 /DNA_START=6 /DNA_END=753 /DNA_ORIENTATION=+
MLSSFCRGVVLASILQAASCFLSDLPSILRRSNGNRIATTPKSPLCSVFASAKSDAWNENTNIDRRRFAASFGAAVFFGAGFPSLPAWAAKGEAARLDFTGSSISSLGKNDLPAAGKIDPYDNREEANAEYAIRMQDSARLAEKEAVAVGQKERIVPDGLDAAIDAKDWKAGVRVLSRETLALRQAMNAVSTRGSRAVSAAQRGGEPESAATATELAEKAFLKRLNQLAVLLDGSQGPVAYPKARLVLD